MQMERLEKLKTRIKEISCNELRRIYPFQLQEWVGVEERELATFIDELLNVNLMEEKYDFQCDCGNDCTVYQKELERNGFVCPECDRNYIPNEIAGKSTVLYEIDKKSLLRYDQSSIDLKKRLRIVREEKDELRFPVEYEQYDEVQKKRKVKVFFSYAHADETYKNELNKHLSPLKRSEKIEAWNDEELLPGSSFDDEIKQKLEQSDIIILLISSDFINSDYCYEIEMQNAMTRAERDECYVVPVIVRACLWKETPLRNIIAFPCKNFSIDIHLRDGLEKKFSIVTSTNSIFSNSYAGSFEANEMKNFGVCSLTLPEWAVPGMGYTVTLKKKSDENH